MAAGGAAVALCLWAVNAPAAVRPAAAVLISAPSGGNPEVGVWAPTIQVVHPASLPDAAGCLLDPSCQLAADPSAAADPGYGGAVAAAAALSGSDPAAGAPPGVSGASGGLAYALALSGQASATSLGGPVAATGVVAADGSVQPVAGVESKVLSAADTGASYLLVPAGQGGPGLPERVEVSTLRQAWDAVCSRGGSGPLCEEGT